MKSSRDIPPRVGMQVRFGMYESKKITAIRGDRILCSDGVNHLDPRSKDASDWPDGSLEIQWTPPDDDERRLFMDAADGFGEPDHRCNEFCWWLFNECGDDRAIAESLALDGADYDDMPDFEELER